MDLGKPWEKPLVHNPLQVHNAPWSISNGRTRAVKVVGLDVDECLRLAQEDPSFDIVQWLQNRMMEMTVEETFHILAHGSDCFCTDDESHIERGYN